MRRVNYLKVVLAIAVATAGAASAMTFSVHDPCGGGNAESCAPRILGRGPVTEGDAVALRAAVARWLKEGMGGFSGITLHSPGGSLSGGIALGMEIRLLKLDTIATASFSEYVRVPGDYKENVLVRQVECHSACVYAFAGGMRRGTEGAIFGVHQFASRVANPNAESNAQVTGVLLRGYLQEMGVSVELLDIASMVPPQQLRTLKDAELVALRLDNTKHPPSRWGVQALSSGQPVLRNLKWLGQGKQLLVTLSQRGEALHMHLLFIFDPAHVSEERLRGSFPEGDASKILVSVDGGRDLKLQSAMPWKRRGKTADGVLYESAGVVHSGQFTAAAKARSLRLSEDNFARANMDVGFEKLELGVDGLAAGLQLLQRAR